MRLTFLLSAALGLAGCATLPQQTATTNPAPATGSRGMVSAADPRAAEAGAEMLRQGGSAADAALATMIALTVVEPQSSGIGGGSFLVYDDGHDGPQSYDSREAAPAAATPTWFFQNGQALPIEQAIPGGRSVGVPGNLRQIALVHRDHGKLAWAQLFAPAIRLARDGFVITPRLEEMLRNFPTTGAFSRAGRALFFTADGSPKPVGTLVRNPALAAFLERLAAQGPDAFYRGDNAAQIVAAVTTAPRNPAPMAASDLAAYQAKSRPPVCGTYRVYRICGMGPPSSGATTVFATLKMLERFDLSALGPDSPTAWHLIAESMRLAYADRDKYLADSDFIAVPVAGLVDSGYLARRSALIAPDRTMATVAAGLPAGAVAVSVPRPQVEYGTSHMVAVDRRGEVATVTSTIESPFGSGLVVNGYYLNNELTDFNLTPTLNGLDTANRVQGGKRPRSSMSPTIVYGPDGRPRLAVGAAGGATIPAQVLKAIIAVLDWKMSAQAAIALPVLFAPGDTVFVEKGTSLEAMAPQLEALGHKVAVRPPSFKANAIEWVNGRLVGAADPRSEGVAVGE
ncbi:MULTISPECIES: gamma-glutamyltransferase [Sphingomonas]|uniref:gamma-glutamyltransferase n=1 Tax=Sphingomonas TaxID=13687 RepID=UPI000DF01583|nr:MULTISPECIES: gamma-glutamyltransferase [Sphingomonas]